MKYDQCQWMKYLYYKNNTNKQIHLNKFNSKIDSIKNNNLKNLILFNKVFEYIM